MFLSIAPNPHRDGEPTRIVKLSQRGGPTWAIDAETLHRQPDLLASFSRHSPIWIRLSDALSVVFVMMAVMGSFLIGWWMFIPAMLISLLLGGIARWLAAAVAKRAARRSHEALLKLHSMKLMWLMPV